MGEGVGEGDGDGDGEGVDVGVAVGAGLGACDTKTIESVGTSATVGELLGATDRRSGNNNEHPVKITDRIKIGIM